jgi:hypothetical protein
VTIGHVASAVAAPAPSFTATSYQTNHNAGTVHIFKQRAEWDI